MKRFLMFAVAAAALAVTSAAQAGSPRVVTQGPCPSDNCLEFGNTTPVDLTARTIDEISPVTGSAIVTFHGMLRCAPGTRELSRLVQLQSQIVKFGDTTPDGLSRGGHVVIGLLWNNLSGGPNYVANTFNLASTRVFDVAKGDRLRLAFRLSRQSMSSDVACAVEKSSAFTIQFVE